VTRNRWWIVGAVAAAVALVVVIASVAGDDDDGEDIDAGAPGSTSTTVATTTSTPTHDNVLSVWPPAGAPAVTDPVEVTRAFATSIMGFTNPLVGSLVAAPTAGEGTVAVRARTDGPVTTVALHQRADKAWLVLGATTPNIVVKSPTAGTTVSSPVELKGEAWTFEGNVVVDVEQDGRTDPIGQGVVTGGGDQLRPFAGSVTFDTPTARTGALVFFAESAEDGSVQQATVVAVRFS
jgi:Immunoglobulin-like domain of bacterial spore germination